MRGPERQKRALCSVVVAKYDVSVFRESSLKIESERDGKPTSKSSCVRFEETNLKTMFDMQKRRQKSEKKTFVGLIRVHEFN